MICFARSVYPKRIVTDRKSTSRLIKLKLNDYIRTLPRSVFTNLIPRINHFLKEYGARI